MRKILCLILCGALLAGCTAAPAATETAAPPSTATPEQGSAEVLDGVKTQRLTEALNGCIAYEADSAGGSLKTAVAAADMVVFLAGNFVPEDLEGETRAWQQALDDDDRATMDANWPGVYRQAQDLCKDPAAQKEMMDTAGVTTDFSAMDLTAVPDQLDTMNHILCSSFVLSL